jgi:hypothetical protein
MGSMVFLPFFLALKAEALYFADRTFEALEAITEAEAVVEDLKGAGGVPNCTGSAACFWRPWVRTMPKLRLRSSLPSAPQSSKRRFR